VIREWVFRETKRLPGPFRGVFTFFALVGKTDRLTRQGFWPIKNFYSKNIYEKTGFSWRAKVPPFAILLQLRVEGTVHGLSTCTFSP
jgi:hypothetical protein